MKNLAKAVLSTALALLLAFCAAQLPLSALRAEISPAWSVPAGYNENDYNKIAAFLEIEDEDGNKSYEKIIESGEVLPHEKNKQFFTLADNQKIVGVKLFSEKEDGSFEPTSTGYFTISENLPKKSRLLFAFNIDLDEIISIKVKVDATGKSQEDI